MLNGEAFPRLAVVLRSSLVVPGGLVDRKGDDGDQEDHTNPETQRAVSHPAMSFIGSGASRNQAAIARLVR
jgi:hypothetical protein